MDGILNIPELVREFVTRRDYIAFYLGFIGFWCFWLSVRGFWLGSTKAFGWRAADATGATAVATGRAWLVVAGGLLGAGATLWFAG